MDLTIYDIIQGPVISDKAQKLNEKLQKLFLNVHPDANKKLVEQAIEKLFDVKVRDVRIQNRKGKSRVVKRRTYTRPDQKRAIVTLKEGYTLSFFERPNADVSAVDASKTHAD